QSLYSSEKKGLTHLGIPIELVDAEKFLSALGSAQHRVFSLSQEKAVSYILTTGLHVGTGLYRDFIPGEDLPKRQVVLPISAVLSRRDGNRGFSYGHAYQNGGSKNPTRIQAPTRSRAQGSSFL